LDAEHRAYRLRALRILEIDRKKEYAKVIPETADDFWHLYNIIRKDDLVYARTTREVKADEKYGRPKRGQRVPVFLGVSVEKVDWDKLLGRLRVHGIIRDAPEDVPSGVHHTLNITLNTPLTVVKEHWAEHEIERLQRARRTFEKPMIIISIDDEGYAIATTAQYGVEERVEQRMRLPGKLETEKRDAATSVYFRGALNSLREVWTQMRGPIAVIGVGFTKNDFVKFVQNEAADLARSVVDVKSVNSSGVAGIYEALRAGILLKAAKQLRVSEEAGVVEEVLKRLGKSESNVTYGFEEVEKAAKLGAVEKLVLADAVLRGADEQKRLLIEGIMRTVERKGGGTTMIVSTEHESGSKLLALGGVAALLRYPLL
jgi:protein pelota